MQKRVSLRNRHQAAIAQLRGELSVRGSGDARSVSEGKQLLAAARAAVARAALVARDSPDEEYVAEMVAHGDSGAFLDRVVAPIFAFLAVHVDRMGSKGMEPAHRIGYDDCNESLCRRDVVYSVLRRLDVTIDARRGAVTAKVDPYDALLRVGQVRVCVGGGLGRGVGVAGWVGACARDPSWVCCGMMHRREWLLQGLVAWSAKEGRGGRQVCVDGTHTHTQTAMALQRGDAPVQGDR